MQFSFVLRFSDPLGSYWVMQEGSCLQSKKWSLIRSDRKKQNSWRANRCCGLVTSPRIKRSMFFVSRHIEEGRARWSYEKIWSRCFIGVLKFQGYFKNQSVMPSPETRKPFFCQRDQIWRMRDNRYETSRARCSSSYFRLYFIVVAQEAFIKNEMERETRQFLPAVDF